ncbi:hypothetical protein EMCG_02674 [[Emmonsia] crescens]|uniref:Uncharacterized protein n=1 Tax=[Emmonsia] crescens TaxID=73230 RepID=A0A0G2J173_9EURO|nr:hypothetical protein EMCG_02674 [Emmonsia crescens UAMH 3008]
MLTCFKTFWRLPSLSAASYSISGCHGDYLHTLSTSSPFEQNFGSLVTRYMTTSILTSHLQPGTNITSSCKTEWIRRAKNVVSS